MALSLSSLITVFGSGDCVIAVPDTIMLAPAAQH